MKKKLSKKPIAKKARSRGVKKSAHALVPTSSHFNLIVPLLFLLMVVVLSSTFVLAQTNTNGNSNGNTNTSRTVALTLSAGTINFGASITVTAKTTGTFTSCSLTANPALTGFPKSGLSLSITGVKPTQDTTFTYTCNYSGGSMVKTAAVKVNQLFRRGDSNGDGVVNIGDIEYFSNLPQVRPVQVAGNMAAFRCQDAADANNDEVININDATFLINYLFGGGTAPSAPGPTTKGVDPSGTALGCATY